jgi:hypothetical protein
MFEEPSAAQLRELEADAAFTIQKAVAAAVALYLCKINIMAAQRLYADRYHRSALPHRCGTEDLLRTAQSLRRKKTDGLAIIVGCDIGRQYDRRLLVGRRLERTLMPHSQIVVVCQSPYPWSLDVYNKRHDRHGLGEVWPCVTLG